MSYHRLKYKIPSKSSLWIEWERITKTGEGLVELKNVKLHGPVLADYLKLQENGYISLDLTLHFILLIPDPYIVRLIWEGVASQDSKEIKIKKAYLKDDRLGLLNKLKNKDKILIDCAGHHTDDEAKGRYRTSYTAIVFNEFNEPYDLG